MTRMHSKIIALVLLAVTSTVSVQVVAFPEIPFCPLGGPPGWANRLFNDHDDYYPSPPYYGVPYWQRSPVYAPVHPSVYPEYLYQPYYERRH